MGFEQAVPPPPSRLQELQAMKRLEDSWISQPYYKYYMNEAVRQPKMALADRINKTRSENIGNMLLYSLILLPVCYFSRRFYVHRGGLPITNIPNYFNKYRTDNQIKNSMFKRNSLLLLTLGSIFLAYNTTNFDELLDRNYSFIAKPPKMM